MVQKLKDELKDVAYVYGLEHPSVSLENDGSVYDDYDKAARDFTSGALWVLQVLEKIENSPI